MKYFIKAIKNYANFNGRANRSEYWYFVLFQIIFTYPFTIISVMTGVETIALVGSIISIGLLLPGIAVACRRMHDNDKSGWYMLIPFYNIYLAIIEGTRGVNSYGEDPNNPNSFDFDNKVL